MKKKISLKIILLLILSAVLVCISMANQKSDMKVYAKELENDVRKPTLNAAVSGGVLSIKAQDTESGIKAVYVNGYEFKDVVNGELHVRLQQFDAGYPHFTIQAVDDAGNMSAVYKTANPYYVDPEKEDDTTEHPVKQLPVSAKPSGPSSATGKVTEHVKTDGSGNATSETKTLAEQKKEAMKEAAKAESAENSQAETGKEFYTIQTKNDKVFYLIIDRDGEEEMVYFLTEITENDLLNVTEDNSEVLPQNSAAVESAIPVTEEERFHEMKSETVEDVTESESTEEVKPLSGAEENTAGTYILLGVFGAIAIGAGYYFKVVKGKKEKFLDEDDEEEEEEILEEDEEETEPEEDDFFEE